MLDIVLLRTPGKPPQGVSQSFRMVLFMSKFSLNDPAELTHHATWPRLAADYSPNVIELKMIAKPTRCSVTDEQIWRW